MDKTLNQQGNRVGPALVWVGIVLSNSFLMAGLLWIRVYWMMPPQRHPVHAARSIPTYIFLAVVLLAALFSTGMIWVRRRQRSRYQSVNPNKSALKMPWRFVIILGGLSLFLASMAPPAYYNLRMWVGLIVSILGVTIGGAGTAILGRFLPSLPGPANDPFDSGTFNPSGLGYVKKRFKSSRFRFINQRLVWIGQPLWVSCLCTIFGILAAACNIALGFGFMLDPHFRHLLPIGFYLLPILGVYPVIVMLGQARAHRLNIDLTDHTYVCWGAMPFKKMPTARPSTQVVLNPFVMARWAGSIDNDIAGIAIVPLRNQYSLSLCLFLIWRDAARTPIFIGSTDKIERARDMMEDAAAELGVPALGRWNDPSDSND